MKIVIFCMLLLAQVTCAQAMMLLMDYGWEDDGTVLDVYPDPELPSIHATNVEASWEENPVYMGSHSLRLEYNDEIATEAGVAVAYLWWLDDGDELTVSFWRYDITPNAPPSVRIWAHWNDHLPDDPTANDGDAGGNEDWGDYLGWDISSWTWQVHSGHTGLVIKAQMMGAPGDLVWLDELVIEAGGYEDDPRIYIQVPGSEPVLFDFTPNEQQTWTDVKLLYR